MTECAGDCPGIDDAADCDADRDRGFVTRRRMVRGDTQEIDFDLLDREGKPLDLSSPTAKAWFTIKRYLSEVDSVALFQGTLASGAVVARDGFTLSSGRVRVTIPASVTTSMVEGTTKLYYDFQVKDSLSRITTVERGVFLVDPDVTRVTT